MRSRVHYVDRSVVQKKDEANKAYKIATLENAIDRSELESLKYENENMRRRVSDQSAQHNGIITSLRAECEHHRSENHNLGHRLQGVMMERHEQSEIVQSLRLESRHHLRQIDELKSNLAKIGKEREDWNAAVEFLRSDLEDERGYNIRAAEEKQTLETHMFSLRKELEQLKRGFKPPSTNCLV
eukprot:CAMPEP_0171323040 /NCGR_PEP_ID=MMETSP0816-20121228/115325_1 /TAXON_ID=420281 /ORGANISM="Proboscia inermis, Strain CCAP1064/1" /LENGTH=183 /DNA_ID=CAMNT_0011821649 /DNA_START=1296 /DNA_END=1846 /DNA_ORIENTATION=-